MSDYHSSLWYCLVHLPLLYQSRTTLRKGDVLSGEIHPPAHLKKIQQSLKNGRVIAHYTPGLEYVRSDSFVQPYSEGNCAHLKQALGIPQKHGPGHVTTVTDETSCPICTSGRRLSELCSV